MYPDNFIRQAAILGAGCALGSHVSTQRSFVNPPAALRLLGIVAAIYAAGVFQPCLAETQTVAGALTAAALPAASAPVLDELLSADAVLRFEIRSYSLDGATLLSADETNQAVAPYIGKSKDFSDVQLALEAIETLYASKGYSAVHVLLPEQELEQGSIRFRVIESRFGKVEVKDNKFVSADNALNALPSVKVGGIPRSKVIAREVKLANENPARQLNVVLKAADKDEEVDATVVVTDSQPDTWSITADNSGTPETGRSRLGVSYRHANLFDKDHVAGLQIQMSPEYMDRVKVVGISYKAPFYQWGDSADFFAGYSNVNSVVGGLSNFQGGGVIFSSRYNYILEKQGKFEPRVSLGLDLRDFKSVEQTTPPVTVLYNEIMVMPLSLGYSVQGKLLAADVGFNISAASNLPWLSKGREEDFAGYDQINQSKPAPRYNVLRLSGNYMQSAFGDCQFRFVFNGQTSNDQLIEGEKIRLGGADGVRGFSEGSEGGERGVRGNLEVYTPSLDGGNTHTRALVFYDAGQASTFDGNNTSISSYGVGLRASLFSNFALRADYGRILKAGNDPLQQVGDWRAHLALSASF